MRQAVLSVCLYDSGARLWLRVRSRVAEMGAGLVVAGRTAASEQLRQAPGTVFGGTRLLSISDLFAAAEAALPPSQRPPAPSDRILRLAGLHRLLSDPDLDLCSELRRCREPADRELLLAWIDRVSARADLEHSQAATTPVERGIELLRSALHDEELVSETSRRAHIARRAKLVDLGMPLVVGPAPLADPFVSGLLKGLSVQQQLAMFGLTVPALVDDWLQAARIDKGETTSEARLDWSRADLGALYSGGSVQGGVELLEAGDELTEALLHIRALIRQGVSPLQITLALARPERDFMRLEQLAARAEVPLLARRAVSSADTPLGRLAIVSARPGISPAEIVVAGRALGLAATDAEALASTSGVERARLLHDVLGALAERPRVPDELAAREMNWVDALATTIKVAESVTPDPSCTEVVRGARTPSLLMGHVDGVAVVGYAEAQGLERSHLVATGLSDGEWPPRDRPSPFISAEALAGCPGLQAPDRRVDFAGALAAHATALLVREARDGAGRSRAPSVLYAAAERAGARLTSSPKAKRRPLPIKKAVADASTDGARAKTVFTVTELSQYLDCPRGWEVKYGLRVQGPEQPQMLHGEITHRVLEAAFQGAGVTAGDRLIEANEAFAKDEAAGTLDSPTRSILVAQIERVIERFSPPQWPFKTVDVEHPVSLNFDAAAAAITGRIDRIDEMPNGDLLLIDYKLRRRPSWQSDARLARNLQACLYPQMIRYELQRPVVGAIFVSVAHDGYDGLVRRLAPGLDSPALSERSDLLADAARANLLAAIDGIRSGRFNGDAPGCWAGCPCQTLRIDGRLS